MSTCSFFDEGSEQSLVKSAIVSKYFWAWAKVMTGAIKQHGRTEKIAYIDLFAGKGRYEDGTHSTPLLILSKACEDKELCNYLVTWFNDMDCDNSQCLEKAIQDLEGIKNLKFPHKFLTKKSATAL